MTSQRDEAVAPHSPRLKKEQKHGMQFVAQTVTVRNRQACQEF